MKVFNLTSTVLVYRGKHLSPGSGAEFPELDKFIPDRDKKMADAKVISFKSIPRWYVAKTSTPAPPAVPPPVPVRKVAAEAVPPLPITEELSSWVERPVGKKK